MSVEITDLFASGMSNCCSGAVLDPSGEEIEGVCADCKEYCNIVPMEDYSDAFENFLGMNIQESLDKLTIRRIQ